ncbi:dopamine receptor 4 isoform X1 [Daphnia magna]|uniref:dopamine receptor 4 isoform X1 n=1 Tax=Daphnia magna TaxID=35525 RepID=UPI001E1BC1EA|nr:dopamine receptor 4 isoform X1 [Daphnia magna]
MEVMLSNVTLLDDNNSTGNISFVLNKDDGNPILALVLFSFCLATILGNALVIAAVARERYLHTVTNYFIMSLAVADCLVGSIVMPFSAAVEMQSDRQWLFGRDLCDVWHSFDVLASTASILNLCVISMDRYWAITDPFTYPGRMTPKRAACFIALVWVCSSLISFPAIAWWRAVAVIEDGPAVVEHCVFTDDVGYLVFSSTVSFYGPLSVMVFTYYRIYRAAVAQSRSLRLGIKQVAMSSTSDLAKGGVGTADTMELLTLRIHRGGRVASDNRRCAAAAALLTYQAASRQPSPTSARNNVLQLPETSQQPHHETNNRRHSPPEAQIAALYRFFVGRWRRIRKVAHRKNELESKISKNRQRTQSSQNVGHRDGRVHRLLVAFLRHQFAIGFLSVVHPQSGTGRHRRHLARMDQFRNEPRHLRVLVTGLQKGICENPVRMLSPFVSPLEEAQR